MSVSRKKDRDDKRAAKNQRLIEEIENFIEEIDDPDFDGQCLRNLKFLYKSNSQKVLMYETANQHDYHNTLEVLNNEITSRIKNLFDSGITKPSSVIHQRRQENPDKVPSRRQVYYEIAKIKKDKGPFRTSMHFLPPIHHRIINSNFFRE